MVKPLWTRFVHYEQIRSFAIAFHVLDTLAFRTVYRIIEIIVEIHIAEIVFSKLLFAFFSQGLRLDIVESVFTHIVKHISKIFHDKERSIIATNDKRLTEVNIKILIGNRMPKGFFLFLFCIYTHNLII